MLSIISAIQGLVTPLGEENTEAKNPCTLTMFAFFAIVAVILIVAVIWYLLNPLSIPTKYRVDKRYYESSRRFVLTGGASGVGKQMTKTLLAQGHKVITTDVRYDELLKVGKELGWASMENCTMLALDVRDRGQWRMVFEIAKKSLGGVDVIFNIAGYLKPESTHKLKDTDIDLHIDVNVKGVINGTWLASQEMIKQVQDGSLPKGGHIVNFASLGALAPVSGVGLYIGSKYAVRGFSLCAAKDLAEHGVFVSVVCPDAIQTPMVDLQESAMAYSGGILAVEDVVAAVLEKLLYTRKRELLIGASWIREKGARFGDIFHDARVIHMTEQRMRSKGMKIQEEMKMRMKTKAS